MSLRTTLYISWLSHKTHKLFICLVCICSVNLELYGQANIIKGRVLDNSTGAPIPFVHVTLQHYNTGTITDIDGNFTLKVPDHQNLVLQFTHVSYDKHSVTYRHEKKHITVYLTESKTQLNEVLITPGENPAHKIIKQVIANRDKLNPKNLQSFSYHSYNKIYLTLEGYQKDTLEQVEKPTAMDSILSKNHLMMVESRTERHFKQPNISNETVVANRVSGYKNPIFSFVPTDLQPIAFYEDHITLLENNFLNPVSPGSTNKYQFTLEDTIQNNSGNEIFVITFRPEAGKNFNGLEGILYINGKDYAIENVEAETANESLLIGARIRQKYKKVDDEHWFPVQYNTQYTFSQQLVRDKPLVVIGKSYLSDIKINEQTRQYSFDHLDLKIAKDAHIKDSAYWADVRPVPLGGREAKTYEFYENHPRIKTIRTIYNIIEVIVLGYLERGPINIIIDDLYERNRYEGHRIGIGLATNDNLSEWFSLKGSIAYGFKDKALKYGGALQFDLSERRDLYLKLAYQQDVKEPGEIDILEKTRNRFSSEAFRDWLTGRMDSLREYNATIGLRPIPHLQTSISLSSKDIDPTYSYQFITSNDQTFTEFNTTEVGLDLRYIPNEKLAKVKDLQLMMEPSYPELALSFTKGFEWLNGEFEYHKINFKVDHSFLTRGLGESFIRLSAGWSNGTIPYHSLYHGMGSNVNEIPVLIKYHFQTMGPYEFLSDKYCNLFFTHDFGKLLFNPKSKIFKPEISITQNFGLSDLDNASRHQQLDFKTMGKGYLESGITINNLIRINYMNFAYLGFGAGVFYRYGPYAHQEQIDNLALKFIFDISI